MGLAFWAVIPLLVAADSLKAQDARAGEEPVETEDDAVPEDGYTEARALLLEGDYEEAAGAFREIVEKDPGRDAARRGWAEALVSVGKDAQARQVLESAENLASSPTLLCALGRLYVRLGSLEAAEKRFREALAIDARNLEAVNRLGDVLYRRGRVGEAETTWKRIVDIYQEMSYEEAEALPAEGFVETGLALIGLNRYQEANSVMFEQAQEKDRLNVELLMAQGRALMAKYNYPDSRSCMRDILDQNPRHADALAHLADNYLTDFQVGTERYALTEKYLKRAIEVNPRHAETYLVRGLLWLSDGYLGKARDDFVKSVELDPSSLRARGMLAACDYLDGDDRKVEAAAKAALELNPRGAEFFHTMATTIEKRFRYEDVVRFCDRAVEVDPDYWPAYATLAVNCMRIGDDARGEEFLEKSWKHDPFNVWVFNTRQLLQHMKKDQRTLKTDRFEFRLPRKEYDVLGAYMAPLLEDAYEKMTRRYQVEIEPPIFVEAFSTHKWFSARTVGLEGFAAAGACFGKLVTLATPNALRPQNWGAVAWHEFAHVITLGLTENRVPRWLTEGLSVYEEGLDHPEWTRNFAVDVADAYGSGRLLPIGQLDFGFSKPKYPEQILMSYFQGCLIVRYIEKQWSFDKVLEILRGYRDHKPLERIFDETLGVTLEEFDRGFFAYVGEWVKANGYEPALAEDVIPVLELDTETDPENLEKWIDLAWAYFNNGGKDELDSTITAHKVLEKRPDHGDAHAILGFVAHYKKEDPKTAREELGLALKGETRFRFRTHFVLGEIAENAKKTDEAIRYYEAAKRVSPGAGAASYPPQGKNLYYRLRDLYHASGQDELAVQQMSELAPYAPEDHKCRQLIVEHYVNREGDEAAEKTFKALNELVYIYPYDPATHNYLARAAERLKRHDVIIREYQYLLKSPDTNPKIAYLALAKAHLARGEAAEAEKYARKVLDLDPEDVEAGDVLEELKRSAPRRPEERGEQQEGEKR